MSRKTWWEASYEQLRVDRQMVGQQHLAVLTLDQPDRRNAMSEEMTASWALAAELLGDDPQLAAVVVTGSGSAFCSGGDLSWLASEPDTAVADLRARMLRFYRAWLSVPRLDVPTVAAINGAAIGAGFAVALACDIRYISDTARVGVPFTALGLHPGMATTWTLPQVAGTAVARDLLLTGRIIDGAEAVRLGLAARTLPSAEVLPAAVEAAHRIATAAPIATRLTLRALRDGGHASFAAAVEWEGLAQAVTMATADLHEGLAAAGERRTPQFHGR